MCMRECRSFNSENNICRPRWGEEVGRKLCKMYQARIQHFSSQPTKNRTTNKISYLINCWWCWSSFDTGKNCNAWMMIFQFVSLTIILWWMFWNIFASCFFSYRRRNGIKLYWFSCLKFIHMIPIRDRIIPIFEYK